MSQQYGWGKQGQGHMPHVKHLHSGKASFCVCQISRSQNYHKLEVNLATVSFGDITVFETVVSVCQCVMVHECV